MSSREKDVVVAKPNGNDSSLVQDGIKLGRSMLNNFFGIQLTTGTGLTTREPSNRLTVGTTTPFTPLAAYRSPTNQGGIIWAAMGYPRFPILGASGYRTPFMQFPLVHYVGWPYMLYPYTQNRAALTRFPLYQSPSMNFAIPQQASEGSATVVEILPGEQVETSVGESVRQSDDLSIVTYRADDRRGIDVTREPTLPSTWSAQGFSFSPNLVTTTALDTLFHFDPVSVVEDTTALTTVQSGVEQAVVSHASGGGRMNVWQSPTRMVGAFTLILPANFANSAKVVFMGFDIDTSRVSQRLFQQALLRHLLLNFNTQAANYAPDSLPTLISPAKSDSTPAAVKFTDRIKVTINSGPQLDEPVLSGSDRSLPGFDIEDIIEKAEVIITEKLSQEEFEAKNSIDQTIKYTKGLNEYNFQISLNRSQSTMIFESYTLDGQVTNFKPPVSIDLESKELSKFWSEAGTDSVLDSVIAPIIVDELEERRQSLSASDDSKQVATNLRLSETMNVGDVDPVQENGTSLSASDDSLKVTPVSTLTTSETDGTEVVVDLTAPNLADGVKPHIEKVSAAAKQVPVMQHLAEDKQPLDHAKLALEYRQLSLDEKVTPVLKKLYEQAARVHSRADRSSWQSSFWSLYSGFFRSIQSVEVQQQIVSFEQKATKLHEAIEAIKSQGEALSDQIVKSAYCEVDSPLRAALHASTAKLVEKTSSEMALEEAILVSASNSL
mgnify:CR=1 FL=1